MSPEPRHPIGQHSGRAGILVLTGMAAGMLMMAGCRVGAQTERVHIRQEMDFVTVNISDSNGSIARVRLHQKGIGCVGTRGEFRRDLPAQGESQPGVHIVTVK